MRTVPISPEIAPPTLNAPEKWGLSPISSGDFARANDSESGAVLVQLVSAAPRL